MNGCFFQQILWQNVSWFLPYPYSGWTFSGLVTDGEGGGRGRKIAKMAMYPNCGSNDIKWFWC